MSITYDFAGQFAIVTGGTRGIGAAVSRALLESGATVCAWHSGNEKAAEAFRESLSDDQQSRFAACKVDVSNPQDVAAAFEKMDADEITPSIVVNSAGIRKDNVAAMMPEEDWHRVIDINLSGTFYVCKQAIQRMSPAKYGRIVNITSPSGKEGFAGQGNYAASKAGVVALTRSLSKEVARRKITVNAVSPGFIETDLIADLPEEQIKAYKDWVPVKRFGKAEEVANAVLFLCAAESAYITGSVVEVTGGL